MNQETHSKGPRLADLAIAFELGLGVAGGLFIWLLGVPASQLWPTAKEWGAALVVGLVATLPMLVLMVAMLRSRWRPFVRLRRLVGRFVHYLLGGAPWWRLLALSLAAGLGEELLFRGALQPVVIRYTTPAVGIALASLAFGAVHAATKTYFLLATAIGAYFGCLAYWRGEIVSAAVAHALYDLVALAVIVRRRPGVKAALAEVGDR